MRIIGMTRVGRVVGSLFALHLATVAAAGTPSFVNDVEPILTRLGCNQGSCHGKGAGQNGFRLSLRGYAPEWDHPWLTREFEARRINTADPTASLLLRKPTGQAPHEGGVLLRPGSRAYEVLVQWIRAGAPGPQKSEPIVSRLEMVPSKRVLKAGETQQLLVRAVYSDGQVKDVTWLTQFISNDGGVAEVSAEGLVKMLRPGETAVRATFAGQVAIALLTAPFEQPVRPETRTNNFIDAHVFKKLAELHIEAAELCSDEVFLRRVYLDTIGVLPTPAEVRAFRADKGSDKRARVIESVLRRPEFIDFWALQLSDLLQNRKESDHDVRGSKGVRGFHAWLRQQVAADRPWDELARAVLTTTGTTHDAPAVGYYIVNVGENRDSHRSAIVANAAQTFLGTRIGCAQCHNHPLEKYTQDDYYHFAGFFSRIKLERKDPKMGPTKLVVSAADAKANKNAVGVSQPRTGQFLAAQPLDRIPLKMEPGQDPRQALAAWMTDPKNEYFAGAMVNRLWAHFFSVGLVEPIDDLRASNPPTNPELWQALCSEFVKQKYDRKHMIRLILNSRTYQLSAATKPGNAKDHRFYSHYYARRLPAEVLLDALCQATGVPERFDGYPLGVRAAQVPDPAVKSYFLSVFGKSERLTACACERNSDVTLVHTLHLLNNDGGVASRLRASDGRLAELLKAKLLDGALVEELFLTALGRLPTESERRTIETRMDPRNRDEVFHDLFWALLNTKEFAFNH
jgi:hypothetical protein